MFIDQAWRYSEEFWYFLSDKKNDAYYWLKEYLYPEPMPLSKPILRRHNAHYKYN